MRPVGFTAYASLFLGALLLFAIPASRAAVNDNAGLVFSFTDYKPFCYKDGNDQAQGLLVDIAREIVERQLKMKLSFQMLPWKRVQYNVRYGKADFFITGKTDQRLGYASASDKPVLQLLLRVFTYADHPLMKQIDSISSGQDVKKLGLIPVTNIGNGWHKNNIDVLGIDTLYVSNEETSFRMLANRRADITIEPIYGGAYIINKLGLHNQVVATRGNFPPLDFYLLLGKGSPHHELMPRINAAIAKLLADGTLQRLSQKYARIAPEVGLPNTGAK